MNNGEYLKALKMLSPREVEILDMVGQGMTNREIPQKLNLSVRTVQNHRQNICKKLNLIGRNSLLKWVLKVK